MRTNGWTAVAAALFTLAGAGPATAAHAQQGNGELGPAPRSGDRSAPLPALEAVPVSAGIDVDGRLDEQDWAAAPVARGFVQQVPDEGSPASQASEIRVLVSGDALYVGARLHDVAPDSVVALLARRDQAVHSDWFYVHVDGYRDRRTAFGFGVNAAGIQRDVRVSEDHREDASWDAVWSSAVSRDAGGWTVELRIPLSQLRYGDGSGNEEGWGVQFTRLLARRNERSHWAPVPRGADRFVSYFGRLEGLEGVGSGRRIELVPYTVARLTRAPAAEGNPFWRRNAAFGAVGADLRVGLGSALTISATVNPDFGQVEADPAVVNLTAFEVFQEERRPFFLEGADLFRPALPAWPPLFHSRRIGRAPQGRAPGADWVDAPSATTILAAVKLSGKTEGGWSIGLLDALTAPERARWSDAAGETGSAAAEPLTHYAAGRLARAFRDGRTEVGVLATSTSRRLDEPGLRFLPSEAWQLALDGWHRFGGDAYELRFAVSGSHVRGDTTAIERLQRAPGHYFQRPGAGHLRLDPSARSLSGRGAWARVQNTSGSWRWGVYGDAVSPSYEVNDLGFNPTLDHVERGGWLRYEQHTPGRLFRSWRLGSYVHAQSTFGGEQKALGQDLGFHFTLPSWWSGGLWIARYQPAWSVTALEGGPAVRRPGRWMGSVDFASDPRRAVTASGYLFGQLEDESEGRSLELHGTVSWRPSDRLSASVSPALVFATDAWQYVTRTAPAPAADTIHLLGRLERRSLGLAGRVGYTLSPRLALELYARPYLVGGRHTALREVVDPGARRFADRFRTHGPDALVEGADGPVWALDRDGDGAADLHVPDPSFHFASAQVNAVLRWEFRPGSTLYAVWTHDRLASGSGWAHPDGGLSALAAAPGRNVLMLKASWWLGL